MRIGVQHMRYLEANLFNPGGSTASRTDARV
jgi:hypothetical protein